MAGKQARDRDRGCGAGLTIVHCRGEGVEHTKLGVIEAFLVEQARVYCQRAVACTRGGGEDRAQRTENRGQRTEDEIWE